MKKYLKGMILFICIMVTLSACGGREIAISQEEKEEISACPKVSLVDTHVPLAHRFDKAVIKNGVLYGCFQEDTGLTVVSDLRQTTIPHATNPQSITADAHGNVYVLAQVEEDNVFWKIDKEGQLTFLENFVLEDLESSIRSIPKGLFVDDEGLFYIWYGVDVPLREFEAEAEENVYTIADRIYVKDSNLNTLYYKQVQDSNGIRLQGFCFQENGTPTLLVQDMEGTYMQELSRESTEEDGADKIYIEGIPYGMECENITLMEGGFLFCQGNSLYQYSFAEQAYEKMLDFATYGISASDIIYLGVGEVTDDIVIEIVDNYGSGNNSEYTILQEGESSKMLLTTK